MKGTIEFSQGAVLYILLMLLVIFVGLMIVTKGQFLLVFEQDSLSSMFGSSRFKIAVEENGKEAALTDSSVRVDCGARNLAISSVKFNYGGSGGKEFSFIIVLDTDDPDIPSIVVGRDKNGNEVFTCTKEDESDKAYDCGEAKDLAFDVSSSGMIADGIVSSNVLHLTAWEDDADGTLANEIRTKLASFDGYTFGDLTDDHAQNYLGSADLTTAGLSNMCLKQFCSSITDESGCSDSTIGCWFRSGRCSACRTSLYCSGFPTEEECGKCGPYNSISCEWSGGKCEKVI